MSESSQSLKYTLSRPWSPPSKLSSVFARFSRPSNVCWAGWNTKTPLLKQSGWLENGREREISREISGKILVESSDQDEWWDLKQISQSIHSPILDRRQRSTPYARTVHRSASAPGSRRRERRTSRTRSTSRRVSCWSWPTALAYWSGSVFRCCRSQVRLLWPLWWTLESVIRCSREGQERWRWGFWFVNRPGEFRKWKRLSNFAITLEALLYIVLSTSPTWPRKFRSFSPNYSKRALHKCWWYSAGDQDDDVRLCAGVSDALRQHKATDRVLIAGRQGDERVFACFGWWVEEKRRAISRSLVLLGITHRSKSVRLNTYDTAMIVTITGSSWCESVASVQLTHLRNFGCNPLAISTKRADLKRDWAWSAEIGLFEDFSNTHGEFKGEHTRSFTEYENKRSSWSDKLLVKATC